MQITNGRVSIEDGKKAAEEYAPARKIVVELSFAVEEGSDPAIVLANVSALANREVASLLGKTVHVLQVKETPAAPTEKVLDPKTGEMKTSKKATAKIEAPKAPEKTKADLEREAGLTDDSVIDTSPKATAPADDDLGDLLGDTAPAPVTDKEISDACIAKANKMKTVTGWEAKKIRLLVEEFVGQAGAKFAQVPAEKRHDFLKRLEELK